MNSRCCQSPGATCLQQKGAIQSLTETILTSKLLSLPVCMTGIEISVPEEMDMYFIGRCLLLHVRTAFNWGGRGGKEKKPTQKYTKHHEEYV